MINGQLPNVSEPYNFKSEIINHTLVAEDVRSILDDFHQELTQWECYALLFPLHSFLPKSLDPNRSLEEINGTIIRTIAKLPTLVAWSYKNRVRQPIIYPEMI